MDDGGNISYKYNCRKCPVRSRCIEESDNSPITKASLRNAFDNKTDTLGLWANLQNNCLLIKAEEQTGVLKKESLLSRRLRMARAAKAETKPPTVDTERPKLATPVSTATPPKPKKPAAPVYHSTLGATSPLSGEDTLPTEIKDPNQLTRQEILSSRAGGKKYWLTVKQSERHIALPTDGELVLGRFDPSFGIPPDVDLTFEDSESPSISRRHARIEAKGGLHTIQEMGSRSGVLINGKKVSLGLAQRIQVGDIITLGGCEMRYDAIPDWINKPNAATSVSEHMVMITGTGQRLKIKAGAEYVIGRSDRYTKTPPDIDLASLNQLAGKVSRRHARLFFKPGDPKLYIEDMGSGFGTKINGQIIMLGDSHALSPGDHIWLGGCVLAYDVTFR